MKKEELRTLLQMAETQTLTDTARAKADGDFIDLPSGNTHYELKGSGSPVVLVHGYATPYFVYDKLFDALADAGYRVLRYDLLGRGLSERVDADYTPALFARQLKELTDAIFPDTAFDLFGHSMGGAVTATFCAQYPGRAKRVVFLAPAGMDTFRPPFYMKLANVPGVGDLIFHMIGAKTLLTHCAGEATHLTQAERDDFTRIFAYALQYKGFVRCTLSSLRGTILKTQDVTKAYAALASQGIPVLCVWGTDDRTMPFYQTERFRAVLPKAKLVTFDGSGHVFLYDEGERTMQTVRTFLRETE